MQHSLEAIVNCGIPSGKPLGHVVQSCPAVLFARDAEHIGTLGDAISGFFSKPQVFVSTFLSLPLHGCIYFLVSHYFPVSVLGFLEIEKFFAPKDVITAFV